MTGATTCARRLKHLPGVVADPHYVQYAVDDFPVRLIMLDTLVPGAGHGELRAEQLEFLSHTLAAAPDKPTLIGMHHPPFACGIANLDTINLRNSPEFTAIIARHRQVDRIICGHHHRAVVARVAHAIASIAPSVAHQVEMSMDPNDEGAFVFEPPAFQLHRWTAADGIVSHIVYVEDYPGPMPSSTTQSIQAQHKLPHVAIRLTGTVFRMVAARRHPGASANLPAGMADRQSPIARI